MENLISQYSSFIFGGCLIVIFLALIGMVIICGMVNHAADNQNEVITYNQNGYHSDKSGYHNGKFTKNNTYNGR